MENTTKKVISILFVAFLATAQSKPNVSSTIEITQPPKQCIGNKLYRDSLNTLYLKVTNRSLMHPSMDPKKRADSIFLHQVYNDLDSTVYTLSSIVHPTTFKQLDPAGFYFSDTFHVYIYMPVPRPVQFICFLNKRVNFVDKGKKYLRRGKILYCQGMIVESIDASRLKLLSFFDVNHTKMYEFITDGNSLYNSEYPMDKESLLNYNLSDMDKNQIIRDFFSR